MATYNNNVETIVWFLFNHVITRFSVHKALVWDHGKHFENEIFQEISRHLGFSHEFSLLYYPQSNVQVEVINKVLKTMLQHMVNNHKTNWPHILFLAPWHAAQESRNLQGSHPTLHSTIELLSDTKPWSKGWYNWNLSTKFDDNLSKIKKRTKIGLKPHSITTSPLRHLLKQI